MTTHHLLCMVFIAANFCAQPARISLQLGAAGDLGEEGDFPEDPPNKFIMSRTPILLDYGEATETSHGAPPCARHC